MSPIKIALLYWSGMEDNLVLADTSLKSTKGVTGMVFGDDVILDILDRQNRANLRGGARSTAMCTPPPLNFIHD